MALSRHPTSRRSTMTETDKDLLALIILFVVILWVVMRVVFPRPSGWIVAGEATVVLGLVGVGVALVRQPARQIGQMWLLVRRAPGVIEAGALLLVAVFSCYVFPELGDAVSYLTMLAGASSLLTSCAAIRSRFDPLSRAVLRSAGVFFGLGFLLCIAVWILRRSTRLSSLTLGLAGPLPLAWDIGRFGIFYFALFGSIYVGIRIGISKRREAISKIVLALKSKSPRTRWQAAYAVANLARFERIIQQRGHRFHRMVFRINQIEPVAHDAKPALVEALRDEDAGVRRQVAQALQQIDPNLKLE